MSDTQLTKCIRDVTSLGNVVEGYYRCGIYTRDQGASLRVFTSAQWAEQATKGAELTSQMSTEYERMVCLMYAGACARAYDARLSLECRYPTEYSNVR